MRHKPRALIQRGHMNSSPQGVSATAPAAHVQGACTEAAAAHATVTATAAVALV